MALGRLITSSGVAKVLKENMIKPEGFLKVKKDVTVDFGKQFLKFQMCQDGFSTCFARYHILILAASWNFKIPNFPNFQFSVWFAKRLEIFLDFSGIYERYQKG